MCRQVGPYLSFPANSSPSYPCDRPSSSPLFPLSSGNQHSGHCGGGRPRTLDFAATGADTTFDQLPVNAIDLAAAEPGLFVDSAVLGSHPNPNALHSLHPAPLLPIAPRMTSASRGGVWMHTGTGTSRTPEAAASCSAFSPSSALFVPSNTFKGLVDAAAQGMVNTGHQAYQPAAPVIPSAVPPGQSPTCEAYHLKLTAIQPDSSAQPHQWHTVHLRGDSSQAANARNLLQLSIMARLTDWCRQEGMQDPQAEEVQVISRTGCVLFSVSCSAARLHEGLALAMQEMEQPDTLASVFGPSFGCSAIRVAVGKVRHAACPSH